MLCWLNQLLVQQLVQCLHASIGLAFPLLWEGGLKGKPVGCLESTSKFSEAARLPVFVAALAQKWCHGLGWDNLPSISEH